MAQKKSPRSSKRLPGRTAPGAETTVQTGDISQVSGDVNVAGKLIQHIETFQQRSLTPGEAVEKDLQIEVNALARGIQEYLERLKQQVSAAPTGAPYKELEAYNLSEASKFFGRDRAIQDLSEAIARGRLTVLQGESGSGKTSLLQAGILPRLLAEGQFAVLVRPQFENPSRAIKEIFIGDLECTPWLARASLDDFLKKVKGIIGHGASLYLVLDQFEEFFSKKTLEQDRQEFIKDLAACLNDTTLDVRWIVSITTDAFGQLGKFEPYIQNPFSNVQSLYLFSRQEAAEVIENTARQHGLAFEKDLLDCVLNDLGSRQGDAIAPTQIQLVCSALYDDLRDKGKLFTCEHYTQLGGAQGILHDYIGSVLHRQLTPEERTIAYKVFEALVTSEKKRLIRTQGDLELELRTKGIPVETLEITLDHLVAGRLLRRYGDDPHRIQYEIVHDYLLKEIEIGEEVVRLKQAEELIEDGLKAWRRDKNLLLTKEHVAFIESQFDQSTFALNEEQAEFVVLSAAASSSSVTPWLAAIPGERIQELILRVVRDLSANDPAIRRRSRQIAWALRTHLPASTYVRLSVEKMLRRSWILVIALLIVGLSFQPVNRWLANPQDGEWELLPGFEKQTGANLQNLSLAIDLDDPDRVIVSDRTPGVLFRSENGGKRWGVMRTQGLDQAILALSLMIEDQLYALTEDSVWVSDDGGDTWVPTGPIPLSNLEGLMSISVNPRNPDEIYIGGDSGKIYHTLDRGRHWSELRKDDYAGKRIQAIATNGNVLVIATEEGLWVNLVETDRWNKISLSGCLGEQDPSDRVEALAIPYPLDDPPIGTAISIWVAVSGVGICDLDTENAYGIKLRHQNPDSCSSLTATGDAELDTYGYFSTEQGIVRYRTWFSNDLEWWRIKIQSLISKGGQNDRQD